MEALTTTTDGLYRQQNITLTTPEEFKNKNYDTVSGPKETFEEGNDAFEEMLG